MLDGVHPADEAHLAADPRGDAGHGAGSSTTCGRVALSEAGTLTLHPEPTDPDVLIEEVVRSFEAAAARPG